MTEEEDEDEDGMLRTVTPQRQLRGKGGMGIFGWVIFLGLFIVMIPLIPVLICMQLYELLFVDSDDGR